MLHILLGTDWTANRRELLSRIAADVRGRRPGRILMVPELISHETERRLCAVAGDTASRYAEVLSFTRLARRASEELGIPNQECLDAGGRLVAMAASARQLRNGPEILVIASRTGFRQYRDPQSGHFRVFFQNGRSVHRNFRPADSDSSGDVIPEVGALEGSGICGQAQVVADQLTLIGAVDQR